MQNKQTIRIADAYLWNEDDLCICLKAVTPQGDPLELTTEEALELASALQKLAQEIHDKEVP